MNNSWWNEWRPALTWGLRIALLHRVLLLAWMAFVWAVVGQQQRIPLELHVDPIAQLPALNGIEQATLGVWRRWDASHYLNLAQNGYRAGDPGPTVFGILTPLGIRAFDAVLPGGIDIGGMVFGTVAFWLALALLYRVCESYYEDANLGRWSSVVMAILPLSFFYSAPMSEAIYVAMALGFVYAGGRGNWMLAAISGALATLARSQGVLIAGMGVLLLWEQSSHLRDDLRERAVYIARRGWPLALVPLALAAFLAFRQVNALPPLDEIYRTRSFIFFVNPLEGLRLNIHWALTHPGDAIFNPDLWALLVSLGLAVWTLLTPRHRRLPLVGYTIASILIFVTKMNWAWGDTAEITHTQSFARYALALFPLTILIADKLRATSTMLRATIMILSVCGLLVFSALFTLGGGAP